MKQRWRSLATLIVAAMLMFAMLTPAAGRLWAAPPRADAQPAQTLQAYVQQNQRRLAYGVYMAGRKVGWFVEELKLGEHQGRPVAVYTDQAKFKFQILGVTSETDMRSTIRYDLEGTGEILQATDRTVEDGSEAVTEVLRKADQLLITTRSGGHETQRTTAIPKDTLEQLRRFDRWLSEPRQAGDRFDFFSADWAEAEVDVCESYTFESRETMLWGGVNADVNRVTVEVQGVRGKATIGDDGWMLTGKMAGILDLRMEKEAVAKQLDGEPLDMLAASAVRVDKPIGDSEAVRLLKLRVEGLGDQPIAASHRQRLVHKPQGKTILELTPDRRLETREALSDVERKRWLASTPAMPADHPSLRQLAQRVVGDQQDPLKQVRLLESWVHENLEPSYAANASNALQVLENRTGDCSEHAMLFVALGRAAGLPSRLVGGLVYAGDETQLFAWHAWAEVHDGWQWVSVDPMWHQVYVDATHIKISEGLDDWSFINVVGRLKLKVVRVKTAD